MDKYSIHLVFFTNARQLAAQNWRTHELQQSRTQATPSEDEGESA